MRPKKKKIAENEQNPDKNHSQLVLKQFGRT